MGCGSARRVLGLALSLANDTGAWIFNLVGFIHHPMMFVGADKDGLFFLGRLDGWMYL